MEEPTQMVGQLEDSEEAASPITAHPVGCLRVCAQEELDETDWPIAQGETVVGRDSKCDLCIPAKSLSRQHAIILVEGDTHFIQDLGSRNKTYRNEVQLRPNSFYELTNGCELLLADVKCQYFIGDPTSADIEQTQAYEFEEGGPRSSTLDAGPGSPKESTTADKAEVTDATVLVADSDGSTVGAEDDWDDNCEPTQAYPLDGEGVADEAEAMDCEATVAYNVGDDVTRSEEETSPASSPLLASGGCEPTVPYPSHPDTDDDDVVPAMELPSALKSATPVKRKGRRVFFEESDSDQSMEVKRSDLADDKEKILTSKTKSTMDGKLVTAPAVVDEPVPVGKSTMVEEHTGKPSGKKRVCFEDIADSDQTVDTDATIDTSKEDPAPSDEDRPASAGPGPSDEEKPTSAGPGPSAQEKPTSVGSGPPDDDKPVSAREGSADKKTVCFQEAETENDDTQPYEGGEDTPEPTGKDRPMGFEPTVAYDLEENCEDTIAERPITDPTVPYVLEESKEEDLESTAMEGETVDHKGEADGLGVTGSEAEGGLESTNGDVTKSSKPAEVESGLEGTNGDVVRSTKAPEVAMETGDDIGSETRDSQQSSGSDFTDTLPEVGINVKQKTLFARQRGRGGKRGRGGRGGAKRGGRTAEIDPVSPDVSMSDEPKSKGKRGRGGRRGKGVSKKSSIVAVTICESETSTSILVSPVASITAPSTSTSPPVAKRTASASPAAIASSPSVTPKTSTIASAEGKATPGQNVLATPKAKGTTIATPKAKGTTIATPKAKGTTIATPKAKGTTITTPATKKTPSPEGAEARTLGAVETLLCEPTSSKRTPTRTKPASPSEILLEEESPDLSLPRTRDDQSDHSSMTSSSTSTTPAGSSNGLSGSRGGGRRGRGRGRNSYSPRKKPAKPAVKMESSPSTLRHEHPTSEKTATESLCVMFTGVVDKDGERTIRQLGGQLVDSVYDCTHLVTDKVRRTVKFLCCLSRGCHIVNTNWLDKCRAQRKLLPAKDFIIKDRAAERQHDFSLTRSLERAKMSPLLAGYKIFLTPNIRPERKEMADIIKCSGGEVLNSLPRAAGEGVLIVTCEKDLGLCRDAVGAGVPVHSTELILGGVLRQELDFPLTSLSPSSSSEVATGATRKRRGKEADGSQPAAKRRKKK